MEMVHLLDALKSGLRGILIKVFAPVDNSVATLWPHLLCYIWCSWGVDSINDVIKAANVGSSVLPFQQSKTPVGCKLGVPDRKEGYLYFLVQPCENSPHKIIHQKPILVLARTIVCMEMDRYLSKSMPGQKMVHQGIMVLPPFPVLLDSSIR